MGRMKDNFVEIVDMYENGYDAEDISVILNIPQDEVEQQIKSLDKPSDDSAPY